VEKAHILKIYKKFKQNSQNLASVWTLYAGNWRLMVWNNIIDAGKSKFVCCPEILFFSDMIWKMTESFPICMQNAFLFQKACRSYRINHYVYY